jgi:hypothetical protein
MQHQENTQNFEDVFLQRIDDLEARAKKVGMNFTSICHEAGASRATPDRWRRDTPKTIKLLARMEEIVAEREEECAAEDAARPSARKL